MNVFTIVARHYPASRCEDLLHLRCMIMAVITQASLVLLLLVSLHYLNFGILFSMKQEKNFAG